MNKVPVSPQVAHALSELEARWPQLHAHIQATPPVWKDSLSPIDADWAGQAAMGIGWLEQASSELVSANIEAGAVKDSRPAYAELLSSIEQLSADVSSSEKSRGFMDNMHFFRKADRRPAAVRLQEIMEERKKLDAGGASRLRGLRDAMEMWELSRVALAGLSDAAPAMTALLQTRLDALAGQQEDGDLPELARQQAARAYRSALRASGALDALMERLGGEFSSGIAGLAQLDEAVRLEETMHARIDASLSKLSAQVAGAHVAQSQLPAILPAPSAPRQGLLARLGWRDSARNGTRPETAKALRVLASCDEISEKEYQHLVRLLADPMVGPATDVGGVPLLDMLISREVSFLVPGEQYVDTVWILAMSDAARQLRKCQPETVRTWCKILAGVETRSMEDEEWFSDEGRTDYGMAEAAARFWKEAGLAQRLPLAATMRFCKSLQEKAPNEDLPQPWKDILSDALHAASPSTLSSTLSGKYADFLATVQPLPPVAKSIVLRAQILSALEEGKPLHGKWKREAKELDAPSADMVAQTVLSSFLADPVAVSLFDDPVWEDNAGPMVQALRLYSSLSRGECLDAASVRQLWDVAFEQDGFRLLHQLLEWQSGAAEALSPGLPARRHPLMRVMQMDGASSSPLYASKHKSLDLLNLVGGSTGTDPQKWCALLDAWKDVPSQPSRGRSPLLEPAPKGYPGTTPLMAAAGALNIHWIRALRTSGVDESLVNHEGSDALHVFTHALCKAAANLPVKKKYDKNELALVLGAMDQAQWWGVQHLVDVGYSPEKILFTALRLDPVVPAAQLAMRHQVMDGLIAAMPREKLMEALVGVALTEKGEWSSPAMQQALRVVQVACAADGGANAVDAFKHAIQQGMHDQLEKDAQIHRLQMQQLNRMPAFQKKMLETMKDAPRSRFGR